MFSRKKRAIFEAWSKIALLLFGAFFVSCATTGGLSAGFVNETAKAGIIIHGYAGGILSPIAVFIDDKNIGEIDEGEIKGYELKNSRHSIYISGNYDGKPRRSLILPLVINNDRIIVQVYNADEGIGLIFDRKEGLSGSKK
jgi:hypothetical protein